MSDAKPIPLAPNRGSGASQSAADRRDNAIANFFEAATSLLRKVEPLVDAAIERDKEGLKR